MHHCDSSDQLRGSKNDRCFLIKAISRSGSMTDPDLSPSLPISTTDPGKRLPTHGVDTLFIDLAVLVRCLGQGGGGGLGVDGRHRVVLLSFGGVVFCSNRRWID